MRIGMIAPISHPYPPPSYGPWERVTHDLTERLATIGHDVTLFAAADSATDAVLVPTAERTLDTLPPDRRRSAEDLHIERALELARASDFDILHSHLHVHVLERAAGVAQPIVTTLHGAAWNQAHHETLRAHADRPFVSLSDREREFLPELNYVATIPNGIRTDDFPPGGGTGGYLAFVGRLAPEKGVHLAFETARRAGHRLLVAGVVDDAHLDYAERIQREAGSGVELLGALDRPELSEMLREATGLLMPLLWDEPFGLVVAESLSSGTPVVAWRKGAMPEIVEHGKTGYLVDDVDGAVAAVARLSSLDRSDCVQSARSRFSAIAMADSYATVYETVSGHGVEDLVEGSHRDPDTDIGVAVGDDQVPGVRHAPA